MGEGGGLAGMDLRVRPAAASGMWESGNSGILSLWYPARKNRFSNGLGHKRSKGSGAWAETESSHTKFSGSRPPSISKNMRVAVWGI